MQMFIRTFFNNTRFLPCGHHPTSLQCSCRTNALCHTVKQIKHFLETENIELMPWPAQSPDLNPVENLWKVLGRKVMAKKPTTMTKLWRTPEEEWIKITPGQCDRLVLSCGPDVLKMFRAEGVTLPTNCWPDKICQKSMRDCWDLSLLLQIYIFLVWVSMPPGVNIMLWSHELFRSLLF